MSTQQEKRRELAEFLIDGLPQPDDIIPAVDIPQFMAVEYLTGGEVVFAYCCDSLEEARTDLENSDTESVDYDLIFDLDTQKIFSPQRKIVALIEQDGDWNFKLPSWPNEPEVVV